MNKETYLIDIKNRFEISQYEELCNLDENGRVKLVRHRESGEIRVKKILHLFDEEVIRRLKKLQIKGLPKIHYVADWNGELVVIEEYIHGKTLEAIYNEEGPIDKLTGVKYTIDVCEIIHSLHSETPKLIHCDIKPSNIMLTTDNIIKIIDINTVRELSETSNIEGQHSSFGTVKYAAPEQFSKERFDERVDIYAIGKTLEALVGLEKFQSVAKGDCKNSKNIERRKESEEKILEKRVEEIINNSTKIEAQNRYQSVFELKEELSMLKAHHMAGEIR